MMEIKDFMAAKEDTEDQLQAAIGDILDAFQKKTGYYATSINVYM